MKMLRISAPLIFVLFLKLMVSGPVSAKCLRRSKRKLFLDGVHIIDQKNKLITIKAVFFVRAASFPKPPKKVGETLRFYPNTGYTQKEVLRLEQRVNQKLNGQHYTVSEGEFTGYSVQFDLDFVLMDSAFEVETSARAEKYQGYAIGNSFAIGNPEHPLFVEKTLDHGDGTKTIYSAGGFTQDKKYITMNAKKNILLNQIHEIFHVLGLCHNKKNQGVMAYPPQLPNQEDINCLVSHARSHRFLPGIFVQK